jgi:hypothetical protein
MKIAIIGTLIACLSFEATATYGCGYTRGKKDGKNVDVKLECKESEVCCKHKNEDLSYLGNCVSCELFKSCPTSFKLDGLWGSDAKCVAKKAKHAKKLK